MQWEFSTLASARSSYQLVEGRTPNGRKYKRRSIRSNCCGQIYPKRHRLCVWRILFYHYDLLWNITCSKEVCTEIAVRRDNLEQV